MQNIFTHVNQFYHSLDSAVCRGRIISLNSTPTMRGADCPSFLAMELWPPRLGRPVGTMINPVAFSSTIFCSTR
jgi:hypothetical protein